MSVRGLRIASNGGWEPIVFLVCVVIGAIVGVFWQGVIGAVVGAIVGAVVGGIIVAIGGQAGI